MAGDRGAQRRRPEKMRMQGWDGPETPAGKNAGSWLGTGGPGDTNAAAGVGIGMKRGFKKIDKKKIN